MRKCKHMWYSQRQAYMLAIFVQREFSVVGIFFKIRGRKWHHNFANVLNQITHKSITFSSTDLEWEKERRNYEINVMSLLQKKARKKNLRRVISESLILPSLPMNLRHFHPLHEFGSFSFFFLFGALLILFPKIITPKEKFFECYSRDDKKNNGGASDVDSNSRDLSATGVISSWILELVVVVDQMSSIYFTFVISKV